MRSGIERLKRAWVVPALAVCAAWAWGCSGATVGGASMAGSAGQAGDAGTLALAGASSAPSAAGGTEPGKSVGGCACPTNEADADSLQCFCAAFPCPSYAEARSWGMTQPRNFASCVDMSSWSWMEQQGCGRIELSNGVGLGGGRWIYEATTHQLIGATFYSDVPIGSCGLDQYRGGVTDYCDQGQVCSLCDTSGQSCAPACSLALQQEMGEYEPSYDSTALSDCQGKTAAERPTLHLGCGRARVVSDGFTAIYRAGTHELLYFALSDYPRCPNGVGDEPEACSDETSCSLCQGDAEQCTPDQLGAP